MKKRHALALVPVALVFGFYNYHESTKSGEALYSFLDWPGDFEQALTNYIGIISVLILVYLAFVKISQVLA